MAIFLFTDFGSADIYVGQVKAVLAQHARGIAVVDLAHEAPNFNARAGAHLLAALATRLPAGSVTMAVVDPGVGTERAIVAVQADERWFVGPDNGLLSVVAARCASSAHWRVTWRPQLLSTSFHGRDVFAPVAAAIATGNFPASIAEPVAGLQCQLGANDLAEVIYIDHYGNAVTGMRAAGVPRDREIAAAGKRVRYGRVFADLPRGELFWYENSLGLVEIAANAASAASELGLKIGSPLALSNSGPTA